MRWNRSSFRLGRGLPLLLSAILLPWPLLAGDPPAAQASPQIDLTEVGLEQLVSFKVQSVYGASKHEQKTTEAPSAVSLVTRQDIKEYGYRTLADILNSVRGFYVTYDRGYSYIGVRGVNRPGDFGGRVLLMVNGHRLNDAIYDTATSGTDFLLDVDLIDRVEVIRGPGSSLYGNNAFFAVINVITRRGGDLNGAELSGAVASYDTLQGRVTYGNNFTNGIEFLLSGTLFNSEGHDTLHFSEFNDINNGNAKGLDGSFAGSAFASISYGDFSLEGGYVDRKKDWPTAAYGSVFNDSRFFTIDERAYAELKYHHVFAHDWEVTLRAYFDHYRYDADYPYAGTDDLDGQVIINRDLGLAQSVGTEAQVSKTLWEKHRLTAGAEYRHDFKLEQLNYDVEPSTTYLDSRPTADIFGLYGQAEAQLLPPLVLNAGLRYDYFSTFGDTINPRFGLIYNPVEPATFKILYGQAFRAPNAYEEFYESNVNKRNPDLGPEKIRSYEFVYEQGLGKHYRFTSSLFLNQIDDLIVQAQDPGDELFFFDNLESAEARGAEAELSGVWKGGWRGRLSYTYTEARDTMTGAWLINSPKHLAKFNLTAPLWRDKLFAGLEVLGMSHRKTVRGNTAKGFYVVNATLFSRELLKGLEISASIYNLFDYRYGDPVSVDFAQDTIEQDGRSFRVKLTYRF